MRDIEIRTNFNVILFNFVDSLSKWDYFVSEHLSKYYASKYGLTEEDEKALDSYSEIRKELGWKKEIELFNWAYDGFKNNKEFNDLLETINYFKDKKELSEELQGATEFISKIKSKIESEYKKSNAKDLVIKFKDVFESLDKDDVIPAYITYSPVDGKTQGGANGDGIYSQVYLADEDEVAFETAGTLFHEYLHKELNPGKLFKDKFKNDGFYSQKIPELYPDAMYSFTEEVIIYALSNVLIFGESPKDNILNFESRLAKDRKHWARLWKAIELVVEPLAKFINNEIKKAALLEEIDSIIRKLVYDKDKK